MTAVAAGGRSVQEKYRSVAPGATSRAAPLAPAATTTTEKNVTTKHAKLVERAAHEASRLRRPRPWIIPLRRRPPVAATPQLAPKGGR